MPAFVVLGIGFPPQILAFETGPVRVGRDPSNDIVVASASASREHAQFMCDTSGTWTVTCVSETNPLVVDGASVQKGIVVTQGSEVLVGTDHMIVFCDNETTAYAYTGRKDLLSQRQCDKCGWTGMLSSVKRAAVCPKCGNDTFRQGGTVLPIGANATGAPTEFTKQVGTGRIQVAGIRIKQAKRSYVECVEGASPGERVHLSEDHAVTIGGSDASFPLRGIAFGSVRIAWEERAFVVHSHVFFARVLLNGGTADGREVKPGDTLQIGSSVFRFGVSDD